MSSPGGTGQSMWANQSQAARTGWGRDGEPGFAFRGMGRGRSGGRGGPRGGGYGRGRGASGFRGGSSTRGEDAEKKSISDNLLSKPPLDTAKPAAATTAAVPPTKPAGRPRPTRKQSDQKSSKKVPSPLGDTMPNSNTISTSHTLPTRPATRRRRSQTPGSTTVSPSVPITAPVQTTVTKDLPPHLTKAPDTPSLHIKEDIDALVEHVRSVAMDRPTPPVTHLDWARDDDEDSLPDLDDWGVTSSTSATEPRTASLKDSTISPILEGTLKALPTLGPGPSSVETQTITVTEERSFVVPESEVISQASEDAKQGESLATVPSPSEAAPRNAKPKARRASRTKNGRDARSNSHTGDTKGSKEDAGKTLRPPPSPSEQKGSETTPSPKALFKVPLHPSLPPKPEAPLGLPLKRYGRNSHGEDALPPKPAADEKPYAPEKLVITDKLTVPEKTVMAEVADKVTIAEKPSADLVKTELPADKGQPTVEVDSAESKSETVTEEKHAEDAPVEDGLSASVHAPIGRSSHLLGGGPANHGAFNPSHGRSRTLGRPPGHPAPTHAGVSDSHSDSATDHGVRSTTAQHLRTQSTPPATGSAHARVHHSRPIITGDAISRLARTLGGTLPRREVAGVSAAKD